MKARGSALIIALLLITAIAGISFGIGRVLFIESASASYYVNGAVAYYSAESGIEEGFLRYRYNKNAEIPYANPTTIYWNMSSTDKDKVFRSNLTSNQMDSLGETNNTGIPRSGSINASYLMNQVYDLRMGFIGTKDGSSWGDAYGQNADGDDNGVDGNDLRLAAYGTGDYDFLTISKDQEVKFDLTNMNLATEKLLAGFKFIDVDLDNNNSVSLEERCRAMVEVKFVLTNLSGITKEYKALVSQNRIQCGGIAGVPETSKLYDLSNDWGMIDSPAVLIGAGNTSDLIGIISQSGDSRPTIDYKNVTLSIKPVYFNSDATDIKMTMYLRRGGCATTSCINKTSAVPGPFSYIESTGYYGGVSRKLEANIDRQSGTLYDLFDYVIFKNL